MSKKTTKSKENAIKAIMEYRNELLEEFLLLKKILSEKLSNLCETGIDNKAYICLDDIKTEQDIVYTVLRRNMIVNLKASLDEMRKDNAMQVFHSINNHPDLYCYKEFFKMEELSDKYSLAKEAIDYLDM